jgi:hypothetical protein
MKTIDEIKKIRQASPEAQAKRKEYADIRRIIKKSLESGDKTIPEIVAETKLNPETVTFYLMTMRRFHEVEVGEIDDMDEYYYYKLKQK